MITKILRIRRYIENLPPRVMETDEGVYSALKRFYDSELKAGHISKIPSEVELREETIRQRNLYQAIQDIRRERRVTWEELNRPSFLTA